MGTILSGRPVGRANKRVESRTGAVALVFRWRITRLSPALPQSGLAWLCFLFPLIEPNRRVSRIRLSEKVSRGRPRKADRPPTKPDQPKLLMQGGFRILFGRRPSYLVLGTQPLPQPPTSMSFYSSVGSADWSKTEIVSPPNHHVIECLYHCFLVQKGLIPSSLLADRLTNALHPFLRRNGT